MATLCARLGLIKDLNPWFDRLVLFHDRVKCTYSPSMGRNSYLLLICIVDVRQVIRVHNVLNDTEIDVSTKIITVFYFSLSAHKAICTLALE